MPNFKQEIKGIFVDNHFVVKNGKLQIWEARVYMVFFFDKCRVNLYHYDCDFYGMLYLLII